MRQRNTSSHPVTLGGHAGVTVAPDEVVDWPHPVAGLEPEPTPTPARRGKTVPQQEA